MVESLSKLNQICQKTRYKEVGNWMVRHFLRDAALPVTWLLLHTPVTANQVTLVSLIAGLIGIICLSWLQVESFLWGVFLLQLWYFLDHVDGQIARYRKTSGLTGRFFDFITHHIIHGFVFFALGIYAFRVTENFFFIWLGFVSSLAIMLFNLINDIKYKTFFEKILTLHSVCVKERPEVKTGQGNHSNFFRLAFSFFHKLCEIHVLMNLLTLGALGQWILKTNADIRLCFMIFYGLTVPIIAILKISYLILKRKIDDEFNERFEQIF